MSDNVVSRRGSPVDSGSLCATGSRENRTQQCKLLGFLGFGLASWELVTNSNVMKKIDSIISEAKERDSLDTPSPLKWGLHEISLL